MGIKILLENYQKKRTKVNINLGRTWFYNAKIKEVDDDYFVIEDDDGTFSVPIWSIIYMRPTPLPTTKPKQKGFFR